MSGAWGWSHAHPLQSSGKSVTCVSLAHRVIRDVREGRGSVAFLRLKSMEKPCPPPKVQGSTKR